MKNRIKSLVQLTANYYPSTGTWKSFSHLSLNERISFRGTDYASMGYNAKSVPGWNAIDSREDKLSNYIVRCLENNIRPFNYSDELWEEHVREVAHEEHTALCENKNAWMYKY